MTTVFPGKGDVDRKWLIVDATELPIGRVAGFVANILMGKMNPKYTPHFDMGDHVIVINAEKVKFSGRKLDQKVYRTHTGRPGSLKEITAGKMMERNPIRPMELAVKGMLPKTKLGRAMYKKLHVYAGSEHVHEAQKPEPIKVLL